MPGGASVCGDPRIRRPRVAADPRLPLIPGSVPARTDSVREGQLSVCFGRSVQTSRPTPTIASATAGRLSLLSRRCLRVLRTRAVTPRDSPAADEAAASVEEQARGQKSKERGPTSLTLCEDLAPRAMMLSPVN